MRIALDLRRSGGVDDSSLPRGTQVLAVGVPISWVYTTHLNRRFLLHKTGGEERQI